MAQSPTSSAVRALQLELKKIMDEPVEGFRVKLANEENIFEWEVAIFGPPSTLYEAGYFKVIFLEIHRENPLCSHGRSIENGSRTIIGLCSFVYTTQLIVCVYE